MSKIKGSDMLLQLDTTGSGNYTTIGGIQGQRLSGRNPVVDVSNQGSANKQREGLAGAAMREMTVTGNGVLDTAAPTSTLMSLWEAGSFRNWKIVIPGIGTYTGSFQISQLEINGPHDKEVTFSITLESVGSWTFA